MNAGYVRLSRDDDKRNYVSIENQKLIINQYAAEQGMVIDRFYEDDGVSGYIFDRPGFNQLMEDLDRDIDTVFVKDFSRLGRHNAKVLLLLDDFQERGKHLIVIDDNYDSRDTNDDTIGIKTWFNERYVKDTSKKIKRAIDARQKKGTLKTTPPFGYKRNEKDKSVLEIIDTEAEYIKMIYDLYINGHGYRKIANYLTSQNIPTPSMIRHVHELEEGHISKRNIAAAWTDGMVKDLLDNDFYTGTLRLKKRARSTVHGKDKRVPKDEQYIFENNHPAIIDKATFELVQDIKEKRNRNNYRGSHATLNSPFSEPSDNTNKKIDSNKTSQYNTDSQKNKLIFQNHSERWQSTSLSNPFGSCLFCKDCGKRLTPISRETTCGKRKYYICTTYNTKGRRFCPKAHLIEENDLMEDVLTYVKLCRNALCEVIETYDMKDFEADKKSVEEQREALQAAINEKKAQLKILFKQKIQDLASVRENNSISANNNSDSTIVGEKNHPDKISREEALINETYDSLQNDLLANIHGLEMQLTELKDTNIETPVVKDKLKNALDVVDKITAGGTLDRRDIELLIERIEVDENGLPEITLKYGLSGLISYNPADEMNRRENAIIVTVMKLIIEDTRGYTSAKYLSEHLTTLDIKKTKKSVLPYIALAKDLGILQDADNPLKPYDIVKSKKEIEDIMENFIPLISPEHPVQSSNNKNKGSTESINIDTADDKTTENITGDFRTTLLQMSSAEFSSHYLHSIMSNGRYARNGI